MAIPIVSVQFDQGQLELPSHHYYLDYDIADEYHKTIVTVHEFYGLHLGGGTFTTKQLAEDVWQLERKIAEVGEFRGSFDAHISSGNTLILLDEWNFAGKRCLQ